MHLVVMHAELGLPPQAGGLAPKEGFSSITHLGNTETYASLAPSFFPVVPCLTKNFSCPNPPHCRAAAATTTGEPRWNRSEVKTHRIAQRIVRIIHHTTIFSL